MAASPPTMAEASALMARALGTIVDAERSMAGAPETIPGALEFEERDSGATRISVPERAGHDDLAMALMLAVSEAGPWL